MDRTTLLGLMAFAVISSALNKARDGSLAWSTAAMRIRKWNSLPHHNRQVDAVWIDCESQCVRRTALKNDRISSRKEWGYNSFCTLAWTSQYECVRLNGGLYVWTFHAYD
jgi:hypothetical protein